MDEEIFELTEKERAYLNTLSTKIQLNNAMEAQAIVGYNEQLAVITECKDALKTEPHAINILAYLNELEAATKEKISDELNHSWGLNSEYTELTGINKAEE